MILRHETLDYLKDVVWIKSYGRDTRNARKGVQCDSIKYVNKFSKRRLACASSFYNSISSEIRCLETKIFQNQLKAILF